MPKVLIFAVCEKVILSTENTVSLITIMEAIQIGVASNTPSDIQLVARTIWYAFSLWQREEGDKDGAHYHQKVELILPDGKMALETQPIDIEFAQGRHNNHGVFQMLGFPLPSASGLATARLLLNPKSLTSGWREAALFPIQITRSSFEAPDAK